MKVVHPSRSVAVFVRIPFLPDREAGSGHDDYASEVKVRAHHPLFVD